MYFSFLSTHIPWLVLRVYNLIEYHYQIFIFSYKMAKHTTYNKNRYY